MRPILCDESLIENALYAAGIVCYDVAHNFVNPAVTRSAFVRQDSTIEFRCINEKCKEILSFSILAADGSTVIKCAGCGKEYTFSDTLRDKFQKFARLVAAVRDAEDILGQTNVGLDIMGHSVQVPYRILLTRMNTFLTLDIGGTKFNFRLRVEPLGE